MNTRSRILAAAIVAVASLSLASCAIHVRPRFVGALSQESAKLPNRLVLGQERPTSPVVTHSDSSIVVFVETDDDLATVARSASMSTLSLYLWACDGPYNEPSLGVSPLYIVDSGELRVSRNASLADRGFLYKAYYPTLLPTQFLDGLGGSKQAEAVLERAKEAGLCITVGGMSKRVLLGRRIKSVEVRVPIAVQDGRIELLQRALEIGDVPR